MILCIVNCRSSCSLKVMVATNVPVLPGWFLDASASSTSVGEPSFFLSWSRDYFVATATKQNVRTGDLELHCGTPTFAWANSRGFFQCVCLSLEADTRHSGVVP